MMHARKYRSWLFLVAAFFLAFLFRAVFAFFPPALLVYEPQELSILYAVMGLSAGLTPAATTLWSIGSIALPLSLAFGIDLIFGSGKALTALISGDPSALITRLSAYLARVFLEPGNYLVIARLAVALISAFAPVALLVFFRKQGMKTAALACLFIFATSPFLVSQGSQAMTDSLAFTFFVLFFVQLFGTRQEQRRHVLLAGVFFGGAVAGKFPYMAFLPVALFWFFLDRRHDALRFLKDCFVFLFSSLVVLLILVPFVWTEPLALVKNIAGNLSMNYLSLPLSKQAFYWRYLARDCGAFFLGWKGWLVFVPIGITASFLLLNKKKAWALILGCAVFLLPLAFSRSAYTRYAMPLFLFVGIYTALAFELLARARNRRGLYLCFFLLFLISALNVRTVVSDFKRTHARTNLSDCIQWVNASLHPSTTIAIHRDLSIYFYPDAVCLHKWRDIYHATYARLDERIGVYFSLNRMKLSAQNKGSPLLAEVFGALERQKVFQYDLLLWYYDAFGAPPNAFRLELYDATGSDSVTASLAQIRRQYAVAAIDALIACDLPDLDGVLPVKVFDRSEGPVYYVYVNRFLK